MTLSRDEYTRMQFLLGKQQSQNALTATEKTELRSLITKENPSAKNADWDGLIAIGLVALGAYLLIKLLSDE